MSQEGTLLKKPLGIQESLETRMTSSNETEHIISVDNFHWSDGAIVDVGNFPHFPTMIGIDNF